MPKWKSTKEHPHGVWNSEVRLAKASVIRRGKVNKLLKLLKNEKFKEEDK